MVCAHDAVQGPAKGNWAAGARVDGHTPQLIDYRAFLESTPLVPWELDPGSGRLTYVGPQAVALLGFALDEWLDADFWASHVLPDDQADFAAARERLVREGGSHVIEYRLEHAEGRLVWVSEAASAVWADGRLVCLRGMLSDVTERKRLEVTLQQSEARLRALLRGAPDAMVFTDADGTIVNINDQARYLLGYTLDEIRGSSVDLLVPERLRPRLQRHRDAVERDPARRSLVDGESFAVQRIDGEAVPVELSLGFVPIDGRRQHLYAFRDLTARRRVEAKLHTVEERLRGMANALPALISYVDSSRRYRFVNEAYAMWARWDRRRIEGRTVREVLGDAKYEAIRPSIEAALAGETVNYLADVLGPTGTEHRVRVSYVPHHEGPEVAGYFVVVVEVDRATEGPMPVHDLRGEGVEQSPAP